MGNYTGSKAFGGPGTFLAVGNGASPEVYTEVAEIKTIKRSGSKMDTPDVTNMETVNRYREYIATLLDAGEISIEGNYIPHDTTQQNLQALFDNATLAPWTITNPAQSIEVSGDLLPGFWAFNAYLTSLDIDWDVAKEATFSAKLKVTGRPVYTDEAV
jgi:predicted secreted protein